MQEHEALIKHVRERVALTDDEAAQFSLPFKTARVRKRQAIIQPDFTPRFRNYVLGGSLRAYVVGEGGHDHTIAFAVEDWWITDYKSYITQQPATMFVVALEDCVLLQIEFEQETKLKAAHPKFETFFRIMAERTAASFQRRIINNLTLTAEERYDSFVERYPSIVQRVPQYALASFLGMSTEFLSKIRNGKTKQKS